MKKLAVLLVAGAMAFGANDAMAQCDGAAKASKEECARKCAEKAAETPTMTYDELNSSISTGAVTVVDARSSEAFAKGHIVGAINVASGDALPADKDAPLVFYCGNSKCTLAPKAAEAAMADGYTNVRVYHEGWAGWTQASTEAQAGEQ